MNNEFFFYVQYLTKSLTNSFFDVEVLGIE